MNALENTVQNVVVQNNFTFFGSNFNVLGVNAAGVSNSSTVVVVGKINVLMRTIIYQCCFYFEKSISRSIIRPLSYKLVDKTIEWISWYTV